MTERSDGTTGNATRRETVELDEFDRDEEVVGSVATGAEDLDMPDPSDSDLGDPATDDGTMDSMLGRADEPTDRAESESQGLFGRLRSALSRRSILPRVFSPRTFLLAVTATTASAVVAGLVIPFFGSLAALGGIFAAGFGFGLLGDRRRYLEVGLAGGATAALGAITEFLVISLVGSGGLLAMVGAGSGVLAALLGHYFGRDLRDGFTREI